MGHLREVGLQDRKEELYMVRVEVQGFEGLVVQGMQQLLKRKQVWHRAPSPCPLYRKISRFRAGLCET